MEKKKQTHLAYGFIAGIIMAIMSLIIYLAGLAMKSGMQWITYIPFLVAIILNAMAFSKANDGYVTFGNVFASCFKMSMVVAIVMVGWAVVTIFVFPEMKDKVIEMTRDQMANQQQADEEQIELAVKWINKGWNVMIISTTILYSLVLGVLFSLIGGAVAKKKGERPMFEQTPTL